MPKIAGKQIDTSINLAFGATSSPSSTGGAFVVIPEMTVTMTTRGNRVILMFDGTFNVQSGDHFAICFFQDGVRYAPSTRDINFFGGSLAGLTPANIQGMPVSMLTMLTPPAGSHTYTVNWSVATGTARAFNTQRTLIAFEFI